MFCKCGTTRWCFIWLFFTGENASSVLVTDCWSSQKRPAIWISRACCCRGISVRSICTLINRFFSFISNICNLFLKSPLICIFFLLCLLLIESRLTNFKHACYSITHVYQPLVACKASIKEYRMWKSEQH